MSPFTDMFQVYPFHFNQMDRAKWKCVFERAQNAQIKIQSLIRAFAFHWYIL